MKISETIKRLEEYKSINGDVDLLFTGTDDYAHYAFYDDFEICDCGWPLALTLNGRFAE